MATQPNKEGKQLRANFVRIIDLLCDLAEQQFKSELNFDDGGIMSEADNAMMRISYDGLASQAFWQPYSKDAKIEAALDDFEEMIEDIENEVVRGPTQTVEDAYILSIKYSRFLYFCVTNAAFFNPVFGGEPINLFGDHGVGEADPVGPTGPRIFEEVSYNGLIWDDLHVETGLKFGSCGYPHITILSIQPQQASGNELMYSEFWTLYCCAVRLCLRVKNAVIKTLPIRLVSLCDRRARVVSAVFSSGYIRCLTYRSADPKGEDVSCKVHIGDYYDFRESASVLSFANEMVAQPIGTETIPEEEPKAKRRGRVSKG